MIRIEKRGNRITVHSPQPLVGLKTTIPGAYQTASGYWTVPLLLESCKLLREKYGSQLQLGTELRRWARGVVDNRATMARLASAKTARLETLPAVAPKLYKAMRRRKYQLAGVRYVADNRATLIADEPGLGKTLIAMGGILEAGVPGPYLVVAPKTASDSVWRREILRWLPNDHRPVILPQFRYQRDRTIRLTRYGPKTWLIVHPEVVITQAWWECNQPVKRKQRVRNKRTGKVRTKVVVSVCGKRSVQGKKTQHMLDCGHVKTRSTKKLIEHSFPKLFTIKWGAIIVDESHDSLIVRTGKTTQRRRGLEMLQLRSDGIKLAMSGTPFDSKPHQLWGTLNWLDSTGHSAFHRWSELFWTKGGFTGYQIGEFRKEREAMLWDSLKSVALRRTKLEVAPDLPPKTHVGSPLDPADKESPIGIWLAMDAKQQAAYDQMEKLSIAELESGSLEATTALAELTRLKQIATCYGDVEQREVWETDEETGERERVLKTFYKPTLPSNKFDWVVESLEEWGYPTTPLTKVVIVSFYTGILEVFREGLEAHFKRGKRNPLCTAITGKTPGQDRRAIIDRFNTGDGPDIMLLNVKAGGTAITLDTADRMIFLSETRIPDQQLQAEDRIHRVSNPRVCMYYYLRSLGTVDVGTALINREMIQDSHRLLDARRGVSYVQRVLDLSK